MHSISLYSKPRNLHAPINNIVNVFLGDLVGAVNDDVSDQQKIILHDYTDKAK